MPPSKDASTPSPLGDSLPRWVTVLVIVAVLALVAWYIRATHGTWARVVPVSTVPLAIAVAEGVLTLRERRRGRREPRWQRVLLVTPLAALGGLLGARIDPTFMSPGVGATAGACAGLLYGLQGAFAARAAVPND